jgi:MOSC domain-containing protein YiiM
MARVIENRVASGIVAAISISERKGIPKTNVPSALLVPDWGIQDDAHAGNWHRQVSLLAVESIEKMRAKGLDVGPGAFAENITTEFIDIPYLHVGDRVRIAEAELEITQIGKECHSRCAIFEAAGDCVMPREGIFGRVVIGGTVRVGDQVRVIRASNNAVPNKHKADRSSFTSSGDRP